MIWRNYSILVGLLLLSLGSGADWGNRMTRGSLVHQELQRDYLLHIPKHCDRSQSLPLLVALHGGGGQAKGFARFTGFNALADRHCFIVVYPQGLEKHWYDARFGARSASVDDTGFILKLIDELAPRMGIDRNRIYLTGMSNGGVFALQLAVERPDVFAAVATVAAQLPEHFEPRGYRMYPLPSLLMINGSRDPIMPYRGGEVRVTPFRKWFRDGGKRMGKGRVRSTEETLGYWRKRTGVPDSAQIGNQQDRHDDGTWVETRLWRNSRTRIKLIKITGGGHAWPGGKQYLPKSIIGNVSREIDASSEIWQFLGNSGKTVTQSTLERQ